MTTLAERFMFALERSGKTKTALAKYCGVTHPSVIGWTSGRTKSLDYSHAVKAAAFLGVNAQWLAEGKGEPFNNVQSLHAEDPLPEGVVAIPEYRVTFGAGGHDAPGYDEITESKPAYYREEWFQERLTASSRCKRFAVHGDSMEPWIFDGDKILVDCSVERIQAGKIYAFVFGDELRVKQLYPLLSGAIRVHSINPSWPDEVIEVADLDRFHLVGRVIDRSGGSFL